MNTKVELEDQTEENQTETQEDGLDDDFEIEIVDDIPEDKKPRRDPETPAPEVPDADDLEGYSESVQKRIKKLTFEYREAERQKEAVAREREEAVSYAKRILEDNNRLKQQLQQGQNSLVDQAKARTEAEIAGAKAAYRQAYELGDADKIMEANDKLVELQTRMNQLRNYRAPVEQEPAVQPERAQPEQQQSAPQAAPKVELTPQQREWMEDNDWYGQDRQMTAFALGVHEDLVQSGVVPDSKRYYAEINEAVRTRFADKFSDAKGAEDTPAAKKASNIVAPAGRTPASPRKRIKLSSSEVAIAKRLGISPEAYAAQKMKDVTNG